MAAIAQLPMRQMVSALHILTDLTLPYGEVIYDYMA
jgi:acetoacetate decarboxylase